jgi:GPH family glycoside/pentoside/hexuronide:cation symporter
VKNDPLGQRELAWYAVGSIPGGIGVLAWNYLVFYYNQVLGIPGTLIGIAAFANSVFDALTDPAVGMISDGTRSRFGRRHLFLFLAAVPSALTFYLMFWVPPGFSLTTLMLWLLVLHLFKRLVDTLYSVPYLALGAEITSDHEERTRLTTQRGIFFNVGRSCAGAVLLLVFLRPTEQYPNGQLNPEGYTQFAALMSGVILIALLSSAWYTRHWVPRLSQAAEGSRISLGRTFGELREALVHRSFRAVLFGSVSRHMAWGMSDTLGIFMITYFWQVSTDILFLWGVGMFTGLFMGLPFWRRMAARFDKKPVAIAGDVTYLIFFISPYLLKTVGFWPDPDSVFYIPLYIFTTGFLAHFGIAAAGSMVGSMLGDVTDADELAGGRRREGVIFGAESFSWKALTGLGPLLAGIVIDVVGLSDVTAPEQVASSTVNALGLAQGGVMFVFFVLAIFFVSRYDLTRSRHDQILAALRERKGGG